MNSIMLVPAYGRDYKSKAAVLADFDAGKDFKVADMSSRWDGKPCNIRDLVREGIDIVTIRYQRLTKVMVINI